MDRVILHSDLNNFFASVECLYHPELRDKPVAVCGDIEKRHGIVLAKNVLAKACGIRTGETISAARAKCRDLVLVKPHMDKYVRFSRMVREIYCEYSDQVENFGIDECWLDVTGHPLTGVEIADELRMRIREELGITASIGVSYNKIFAKMGSDYKKPDATTVITRENYKRMLWPLPVCEMLFVGRSTAMKLKLLGIISIGDLAMADCELLDDIFGKNGVLLWKFANGLDMSPVIASDESYTIKSVGNTTTAPRDLVSEEDVKVTLWVLCESVAARLRADHFKCTTVQLHMRDTDLHCMERQEKLPFPTFLARDLYASAMRLYRRHHQAGVPLRSIGVRGCGLVSEENQQLSFIPAVDDLYKRETLEETVDGIRGRFGNDAIQRGILLTDRVLSGFTPRDDHVIHPDRG